MIAGSGLFRPSDQHRDALVATARVLGERHAAGVANHDRDATIHCALIDDLCAEGYHAAPIDRRYGGGSHRLVDIIFAQAALLMGKFIPIQIDRVGCKFVFKTIVNYLIH